MHVRDKFFILTNSDTNPIHQVLLMNKKFHWAHNFNLFYLRLKPDYPSLKVVEFICQESKFAQYRDFDQVVANLEDTSLGPSLKNFIQYIPDLNRSLNQLTEIEQLYTLLIKLLIQPHPLVIIDPLPLHNYPEIEAAFLQTIQLMASDKTFFFLPQNNLLSSLASYNLIFATGCFKIENRSTPNEKSPSNVVTLLTEQQQNNEKKAA